MILRLLVENMIIIIISSVLHSKYYKKAGVFILSG